MYKDEIGKQTDRISKLDQMEKMIGELRTTLNMERKQFSSMKHSLEYKMNKMENEMQRQQTEMRDLNDRISDLV